MVDTLRSVADQSGIVLLDQPIGRPGPALRPIRGELHAPARHIGRHALRLFFRRQDEIGKPRARHALRDGGLRGLWRIGRGPFVRGPAGNDGDIVAGLAGERPVAGKPGGDASRSGIVGRGGKPEIAEPCFEIA